MKTTPLKTLTILVILPFIFSCEREEDPRPLYSNAYELNIYAQELLNSGVPNDEVKVFFFTELRKMLSKPNKQKLNTFLAGTDYTVGRVMCEGVKSTTYMFNGDGTSVWVAEMCDGTFYVNACSPHNEGKRRCKQTVYPPDE